VSGFFDQILRFLGENLVFVIVAIGWIVSSLGGVLATAARNAEKRRREAEARGHSVPRTESAQTRTTERRGGATQDGGLLGAEGGSWRDDHEEEQMDPFLAATPTQTAAKPTSARRSPEDIAAEIRRVMGLEGPVSSSRPQIDAKEQRERAEEMRRKAEATRAEELLQADRRRAEREAAGRDRAVEVERRRTSVGHRRARPPKVPGRAEQRGRPGEPVVVRAEFDAWGDDRGRSRRRRRERSLMADLRDPARAIVLAEVFGPPRGLRAFDEESRGR
jgi:hypothetical protein